MAADELLDPISAVAANVGSDALAFFDGQSGHGLVEVGARLGAAVGDEVIDLFGLRALEEHGVRFVRVLVGVVRLRVVLLVVWLVVGVRVGVELLLVGVIFVRRVASEVGIVVRVHLHEIIGVVLLLAHSILLLGLFSPNKIIIIINPTGLKLIHNILGILNLLPPLQRAIL